MINTVIFDLDDTLYYEKDYCKSGFHAVADHLSDKFNKLNRQKIFDLMWKEFQEGDRRKIFNKVLNELSLPENPEIIKELVKVYRGHAPDISLAPETRQLLTDLIKKYTLALLTDGFLPAQQLKVKALDIEKYFEIIVYTEELGREYWKPSARGFEKIIKKLQKKPENMIYVADNETKDFYPANQLNMASVKLETSEQVHHYRIKKAEYKPRFKIKSLNQLPELLEKL